MYQDDYIIAFDENGQPYIAHASWLDNAKNAVTNAAQQVVNKAKGVGRGVRQNHKYILKVIENGKARYMYTQKEVDAYYKAKKAGIKNAAEYAQNAVKGAVDKATGATANKAAETANKHADDAHRWAKMTERAHKENLANFKQNPTEANLAKAKQSGQAVTRANQNEKNARKEADKAQVIADQHPANKAKSAFDQAKNSADNAVANAKNAYERMKTEFKDKAESVANKVVDKAKDFAGVDEQKERDRTRFEAEKPRADVYDAARANIAQREYDKTPLGMIDRARVAVKDKSEDLSAKAQSTVQSARDSVQGMIDNARSSTAKAVNEAWDKIPKNADGTVNPFDKNFQSTYNDWKSKKDKYDSSLADRAKDAAEKATDAVQDMIDQARTAVKDKSEDLSAKAKSTVQSARDSVKGMIDTARKNARSEIDARRYDKVLDKAGQAYDVLEQARDKANAARRKADDTHTPEDIAEYKRLDKEARAASSEYKKALNEAERVTESASKGTAAKLEEAQRAYINDKTRKDYKERVKAQEIAQKKYSDYYQGLVTKYGFENGFIRKDEISERDLSNLKALEEKLVKANDALYATERAYNDALYDYKNSPLGKVESKKKNK